MWWQFQSSGICLESDGLSFEVVCLAFCIFSHYFDHAQSTMKYMCKKKHNFYVTKYIWKKKTLYYWPCWRFVWREGGKAAKTHASYDENRSASPLVRARKFAAFSSLFFPFHQTNRQLRRLGFPVRAYKWPSLALRCFCYFCRITMISL